jgi:Icc-related predicted phosphoesterase
MYKPDVLICSGDLTGKMIIPIVEQPDGKFTASFLGTDEIVQSAKELETLEERISSSGFYPYRCIKEEKTELDTNEKLVKDLFIHLMNERIRHWVKMAEERLKGADVKLYISPGNDDEISEGLLESSTSYVINPEGKVVEIDDYHEMVTIGNTNETPWNCPGDITEEELAEKIEVLASQVDDMENCVFNFHCPPYDTPLDVAPKLDENLRPVLSGGQIVMSPAGCVSVLQAIQEHQPLIGLHGHIHESKGTVKIGRTLCINPGSEYGEGILDGALVILEEKRVKGYLLTSG